MSHRLNVDELQRIIDEAFPSSEIPRITDVSDDTVTLRQDLSERHGRPGGTVSGPTMMGLADLAAWVVTMAHVGPALLAVTTSLHIDFLRKPELTELVARGRLIKLGKRLSVSDVELFSGDRLVAKAQVTYSIPHEHGR